MAKILVVCATRAGETRAIGDLIAEGIRIGGGEAIVRDIKEIKKESDLNGYDGYVFGSATYHGEMLQSMKTMLFMAEKAELTGKTGGAFGAYGWSGEAPGRIFHTMEHIFKMNMISGPLQLKSGSLGGGLKMAHEYGKEILNKINT